MGNHYETKTVDPRPNAKERFRRVGKNNRAAAEKLGKEIFRDSGARIGDPVSVEKWLGKDPSRQTDLGVHLIEGTLTEVTKIFLVITEKGAEEKHIVRYRKLNNITVL